MIGVADGFGNGVEAGRTVGIESVTTSFTGVGVGSTICVGSATWRGRIASDLGGLTEVFISVTTNFTGVGVGSTG